MSDLLKDKSNKSLINQILRTCEGITEKCSRLTPGNIAHQVPHIQSYAEFIKMFAKELKKRDL